MEKRERDNRELRRQFKEEKEEHHHLLLIVVQLPQALRYSSEDMSS